MFNKTKFDEYLVSSEVSNFTYIDTEYSNNSKHYYKEICFREENFYE